MFSQQIISTKIGAGIAGPAVNASVTSADEGFVAEPLARAGG